MASEGSVASPGGVGSTFEVADTVPPNSTNLGLHDKWNNDCNTEWIRKFIYASNGRLGSDRYNEGVYGASISADGGVSL